MMFWERLGIVLQMSLNRSKFILFVIIWDFIGESMGNILILIL